MTGPILTRLSLHFDPSALKGRQPGEADYAVINNAVESMLAEQTKTIAKLAQPQLTRLAQRWEQLAPQLLAAAAIEPKQFAAAAAEYSAQLQDAAAAPAKERLTAIAGALKSPSPSFAQAAAAIKPVLPSTPSSTVVVMGSSCIFGAIDADYINQIELYLAEQQLNAQCLDQTIAPPYPVFGSTGIDTSPMGDNDIFDPATGRFSIKVISVIAGWPHKALQFGATFTVRDTDTHVIVSVALNSQRAAGRNALVGGLGYAHAWSQLNLTIDSFDPVASSGPTEPFNISSELVLVAVETQENEVDSFTLTCSFDRAPGDALTYVASVQASVDLTCVALGAGLSELGLNVEHFQVHACS